MDATSDENRPSARILYHNVSQVLLDMLVRWDEIEAAMPEDIRPSLRVRIEQLVVRLRERIIHLAPTPPPADIPCGETPMPDFFDDFPPSWLLGKFTDQFLPTFLC